MALQLIDGVLVYLADGQVSLGSVQDVEGDMVRPCEWYPSDIGGVSVGVVVRLDDFTVAHRGVVE